MINLKELKRFTILDQTFEYQFFPGRYFVEAYGPAGGGDGHGYGAYVSGAVRLREPKKVYITLRGKGKTGKSDGSITPGGSNGGGKGGSGKIYQGEIKVSGGSGGGKTVISLNEDQTSPIIVAAGGGGGVMTSSQFEQFEYVWGDAGGISSNDAVNIIKSVTISGVNQTFGSIDGNGQDGNDGTPERGAGAEGSGGGGAGYLGGLAKPSPEYCSPGTGGSSYISGHRECLIEPSFTFTNIVLKNGTETKYDGDGYVIISRIYDDNSLCRYVIFAFRSHTLLPFISLSKY